MDFKSTVELCKSEITQPAFTCSKLTIEILEQGVNMFKVNNKYTRTSPLATFWCIYC